METRRGLPWVLLLLCALTRARGQRDFDLADALDDPEPTKKPSSVPEPTTGGDSELCKAKRSLLRMFRVPVAHAAVPEPTTGGDSEISTPNRSPRTAPSLETRTTEAMSTQGRNPNLTLSRGILVTAEVTLATRMTNSTRPSRGRPQGAVAAAAAVAAASAVAAAAAVEAASAAVAAADTAATGTRTVETDSPLTATRKATRWPESCPPSCLWWWWPWWGPGSATSSPTGGGIAFGAVMWRRSEDAQIPGKLSQVGKRAALRAKLLSPFFL